jgi:hypothetical protein
MLANHAQPKLGNMAAALTLHTHCVQVAPTVDRSRVAFVCLTEEAIANGEMPSVMGGRGPFDLVVVEDVVDKLVQPLHLVHALPSLVRSSTGYAHSMTVTHSVSSMRCCCSAPPCAAML